MSTLQYQAVEISTEKFKQLNCALCFTSGDFIENLNFCIECRNYYCPSCLNNHLNSRQAKFSQTRLDDEKSMGPYLNINENDTATNRNHYEKGTNCLTDIQVSESDIYQNLAKALRKKQFELRSLGTQKDAIMNIMKQLKECAADLLQEFENTINEKIKAEEEETKKKLGKEIQQLEKSMNNLKHNAGRSEASDTEMMYNRRSDAEDEKENLGRSHGSESYSNMQDILESAIEDFTYRINKTGSYLIEESGSLFVQTDKLDVKMREDRTTCDINDMCQLQDGTILLCDWNNIEIKRLKSSCEIQTSCPMPSIPWSICPTGPSQVAVSLFLLKRVQFVKLSSTGMKLTRNFKVGEVCRGVCYTDNKLVVSCGGGGIGEGKGHLRIFNKFGILLNIVQEKAPRDPIFSCPFHLTASQGLVYLTDRDKGLVCLQWSGLHQLQPAQTPLNPHLALAKGICDGEDGDLFICDFKNGTVVSLNTTTNASKALVQQKNKLTGPQSICYNSMKKELIVAAGSSNYIQTYQLTVASKIT